MSGAPHIQQLVVNVFKTRGPLVKREVKPFSVFQEEDAKEMKSLLQTLTDIGLKSSGPQAKSRKATDEKGLLALVGFCSDCITKKNLHPRLVKFALGVFLAHSTEAQDLGIISPPLKDVSEFIGDEKAPLVNPVTQDTLKGFDTIAYFREDYGLNEHHYYWHQVFPHVVHAIDRQGEIFLYMHSQMLARYNAELLSWDQNKVQDFHYDDVPEFGHTPVPAHHVDYGIRPPFQGWYEKHNPDYTTEPKTKMNEYRNNINEAIRNGFFYTVKDKEAHKLHLTCANAMNWVGIVVEGNTSDLQIVSPGEVIDRDLYGSLHNSGHMKFSELGFKKDGNLGVMSDTLVAIRDPIFWQWHKHIDSFRQEVVNKYKQNLDEFNPHVEITELKIMPQNDPTSTNLSTFLGPPKLDDKEVNAKIDHEPYQWEVEVKSIRYNLPTASEPQTFTVRIFVAPKVLIDDQRAWIEMDKFTHTLRQVSKKITRLDTDSSVAKKVARKGEILTTRCKCGWPQNMMLPNGTPEGIEYVGFAMLTNDELTADGQGMSFCGSKDKTYPDPRGMGYPFEKTWSRTVDSNMMLPEVVEEVPHTKLCHFKIYRHTKMYKRDE